MKTKKIVTAILISIAIITIFVPSVNATINPDNFRPGDLSASDYNKPFKFATTILSSITIVGVVISVIMVMVLGIKYMMGSLEEKAEYKKTMIPMLIGAILLFCSSTLVSIIYKLITQMK